MKRIIITICAVALAGLLSAQNVIDTHFKSLKEQPEVTKVHVTGKMFELAAYIDNEDKDPDIEEFKKFASTIDEFNMIVADEIKDAEAKYNGAVKKLSASHEELLSVEEKDGSITFFIKESKGIVSELAMTARGSNEFVVFSLTGNMDLRQISRLSRKLQSSGLNHAGKLFENGVHELKVYPNPVPDNSTINVEAPKELQQGKVSLIDMNGRTVKTNQLDGSKIQFNTSGLPAGTYILEIKNDKASVKRKVVLE